jgi:tetratricopeptide (TPR) repeat protein
MLTRLEVFRVARGICVADLIAESGISRAHLLRMRKGELQPRRDMIAAVVSALRYLSLEDVRPEDVIELIVEESGPWQSERPHRVSLDVEAWKRERDAAVALLAELERRDGSDWLAFLRASGANDAHVRALIFEGQRIIDTDPPSALSFFATATQLAEGLMSLRREYRLALAGRSAVEHANAFRQLGKLRDALPVLDRAERQLEGEPYCTKELGRAWLTRGTVLQKIGDLDRAERYLRRAINIFAAVDDTRRIAKVRMVQASVMFERGDFLGARSLWESGVPVFKAGLDRHALGVSWLNIGLCDTELGDASSARSWFERALHVFERIRCDAEILRTRAAIARCNALYDDRNSGIATLMAARTEFERLSLEIDAAMVLLDVAELLLIPPRRPKAAAEICATLPNAFDRAGATRESKKAIAYLSDAASRHMLTANAARHVRTFVWHAEEGRGEPFVPPHEHVSPRSPRPRVL